MISDLLNRFFQKEENDLYNVLLSQSISEVKSAWFQFYKLIPTLSQPDITFPQKTIDFDKFFRIKGSNPGELEKSYTGTLHFEQDKNKAIWKIGIGDQFQWGEYEYDENALLLRIHFHYKEEEQIYNGIVMYRWVTENKLLGFWVEEEVNEIAIEWLEVI